MIAIKTPKDLRGLKFDTYDKINLSTNKNMFEELVYKDKVQPHPRAVMIPAIILKKSGQKDIFKNSLPSKRDINQWHKEGFKIKQIEYPSRRFQNTDFGTVEFSVKNMKLVLTKIDYSKPVKPQIKAAIRYLIEKGYIIGCSTSNDMLNYHLKKFGYSEIELNAYFKGAEIFETLARYFYYTDPYPTTIYIWTNGSTKFYCYNVSALERKKTGLENWYNLPDDIFKFELTLKNGYINDQKLKELTFTKSLNLDILDNPKINTIMDKAYNAVFKACEYEDFAMKVRMHLDRRKEHLIIQGA